MNIFRLTGDLLHLLSIFLLIHKIIKYKSCAGVSLKSIQMYFVVFVTRYLDLLHFISVYNTSMKIFYITSTAALIYLIQNKYRATYDRQHDTFKVVYLLLPSAILGFLMTDSYDIPEVSAKLKGSLLTAW